MKTQSELVCPKCKSKNIEQFRMPTGAIWCKNCGFEVLHKEIKNPFIKN
jgi:predicted Zn-ribbon and HTH transcriptional regulator